MKFIRFTRNCKNSIVKPPKQLKQFHNNQIMSHNKVGRILLSIKQLNICYRFSGCQWNSICSFHLLPEFICHRREVPPATSAIFADWFCFCIHWFFLSFSPFFLLFHAFPSFFSTFSPSSLFLPGFFYSLGWWIWLTSVWKMNRRPHAPPFCSVYSRIVAAVGNKFRPLLWCKWWIQFMKLLGFSG